MRRISVGKNLTADVENTVYTVPNGYTAGWNLMYLFNNSGSTKSCSVIWRDGSDIYVYNGSVANGAYVQINGTGSAVQMEEGDSVVMQSEAGSSFSTICTFELEKKQGI